MCLFVFNPASCPVHPGYLKVNHTPCELSTGADTGLGWSTGCAANEYRSHSKNVASCVAYTDACAC